MSESAKVLPFKARAKFDRFAGGRHLEAINYVRDKNGKRLTGTVRAILKELASLMDFRDLFKERFVAHELLSDASGFGLTTVRKALKLALELGVIDSRGQRYKGRQGANYYRLTPKLFEAFEASFQEAPDDSWEGEMDDPPEVQVSPRDSCQVSPRDTNPGVATRYQAPKAPNKTTPKIFAREAREIGEYLFLSPHPETSQARFVSMANLRRTMSVALDRFGIEVLKEFVKREEQAGLIGTLRFNEPKFFGALTALANEGLFA